MINQNKHDQGQERNFRLLEEISFKLGLNIDESKKLAGRVYLEGLETYQDHKKDFTLQQWLARLMIKRTIFLLSQHIFKENGNSLLTYSLTAGSTMTLLVPQLPMTFRAVYILYNYLHFDLKEIALLLNISTQQVKERLKEATVLVNQ